MEKMKIENYFFAKIRNLFFDKMRDKYNTRKATPKNANAKNKKRKISGKREPARKRNKKITASTTEVKVASLSKVNTSSVFNEPSTSAVPGTCGEASYCDVNAAGFSSVNEPSTSGLTFGQGIQNKITNQVHILFRNSHIT